MISIINNGQLAKKSVVKQYRKKSCEFILNIMWNEGFILGYKYSKNNPKFIKIFLKYKNGKSVINNMKILSKPSLRIYYSVKQLWKLESDTRGLLILSTNKGFMSSNECKKKNIGGEPFVVIK